MALESGDILHNQLAAAEPRMHACNDSHKVALEEILQLPLGCRIGKVADVQAATFGGAGKNGVIGRLVVLVRDRGIGQSVGNVIDGSGRGVSNFLHGGRHIDWYWMVWLEERFVVVEVTMF